MNLESLLNKFKIKKGDKIIVTSNIVKILIKFKNRKIDFDPNILIDALIKKIGKNGTLLIPTFNWDFCKGKTFKYHKTPSQSGALGNIALRRKDFLRSFNPIYSFAVTGKDKKKICTLKHVDCFSLNSPFGYLIKNKGKNLFIDLEQRVFDETKLGGFTFHHVVEQAVKIPYRYFKVFKGYYINKQKLRKLIKIKFYARNLKLKYKVFISKKLDNELLRQKILQRRVFKGINLDLIDLNSVFKILTKDLKTKKFFFIKKY